MPLTTSGRQDEDVDEDQDEDEDEAESLDEYEYQDVDRPHGGNEKFILDPAEWPSELLGNANATEKVNALAAQGGPSNHSNLFGPQTTRAASCRLGPLGCSAPQLLNPAER